MSCWKVARSMGAAPTVPDASVGGQEAVNKRRPIVAASPPRLKDQAVAVLVRLDPSGPVVVDPRAPYLRADDLGVLRGDGVFERFLVRAGQPRHLEDHLGVSSD